MSEHEIIKGLQRLGTIAPDREYASVSKLLILMSKKDAAFESIPESAVVENVSTLRSVRPSDRFTSESRAILLAHPRTIARKALGIFSFRNLLTQGASYGLSVSLAAVLIAIIVGGGVTFFRALPGVNDASLVAEANNVIKDIDIHLENANYYAISADKTRVALDDAQGSGPDHANQAIIEKESRNLDFEKPTGDEIGDLLNQATL